MNIIKPILIAGAISLTLNSCFLFRSKHQSCPAYGQEIKKQNDATIDVKIEKTELAKQA